MALMVLWVEAMGRGEWVGAIDGERGFCFFFFTFQPTSHGAAFRTVNGGIDGFVGGSHGRG